MVGTRIAPLPLLPERPADGHKGTFGTVLIVGGSRGMSGAAALAGLAALRGGAGLVRLAVPESVVPIVSAIEPSYLTTPLPEDAEGRLRRDAAAIIQMRAEECRVVAIGPGLGQSNDLRQLVVELFMTLPLPMVVDADALNALANSPEAWSKWMENPHSPRILTPHPGEFSRLSGTKTGEIQQQREDAAAAFAIERKVILVLKGQHTVIADAERIAVNTTGNSGMATGGTGDVLTGLIAALVAQRMPPFEAAQLGAHLHGLAGDLAAAELTEPGLIASDLPRYVALAWKQLLS